MKYNTVSEESVIKTWNESVCAVVAGLVKPGIFNWNRKTVSPATNEASISFPVAVHVTSVFTGSIYKNWIRNEYTIVHARSPDVIEVESGIVIFIFPSAGIGWLFIETINSKTDASLTWLGVEVIVTSPNAFCPIFLNCNYYQTIYSFNNSFRGK